MGSYNIKSGASGNKDGTLKDDQESTWEIARNAANATNSNLNGTGMQIGSDDWPCVYRAFLWFNTSSIPSIESVTSAKLWLKAYTKPADKDFDIVIQKGIAEDGNGNPVVHHDPCVAGDYDRTLVAGDGGSLNTSNLIVDTFVCLTLNSVGRGYIKKGSGAITKLCLRSKDDIDNVPPENFYEFAEIYNGNTSTESQKPYLEIQTTENVKELSGTVAIVSSVLGYFPVEIENVKATKIAGHLYLYGNIDYMCGKTIVERGFEYLVQEAEPDEEDTGTEVKETDEGGFNIGEYHLSSWDTFEDLYRAEEGTIWWFRAYCLDDAENKFTAEKWMKNMPTVTTQAVSNIYYNKADGNGEITDKGASDLTQRGFEVSIEYSGSYPDSWKFEIAGFEGELECVPVKNAEGFIVDFKWEGVLTKIIHEEYGLEVEPYSLTMGEMIFGWPVADNCLIEGKSYKCMAFAKNIFGTSYGSEVGFETPARDYLSDEEPDTGPYTVIKNERIQNLPSGIYATRRGFR